MCNSRSFIDWLRKKIGKKTKMDVNKLQDFFYCSYFFYCLNYFSYNFFKYCSIWLEFGQYVCFEVLYRLQKKKSRKNNNCGFFYCSPSLLLFLLFTSIISVIVVRFDKNLVRMCNSRSFIDLKRQKSEKVKTDDFSIVLRFFLLFLLFLLIKTGNVIRFGWN
jgi:hypothetical protein